jgi:hypothetical protein
VTIRSAEITMQTLRRPIIRLSQRVNGERRVFMCAAISATLLSASIAAADGPPQLNVSQSCQAAARGAIIAGRDKEACLVDERLSQDQITKNWSQYAAADKTLCVGMNKTGGPPSYVELLSCLEIMRDAKTVHKDELADPLLNKKGEMNTRTLVPTDLDEGILYTRDDKKTRRGHKRNHRE